MNSYPSAELPSDTANEFYPMRARLMPPVTLRILGECIIEVSGRSIKPDAPLLFALTLYLCGERGRAIPRAEILELLFPGDPTAQASAHNLRQLLYRLRRLGTPIDINAHAISIGSPHIENALDAILNAPLESRVGLLDRSVAVLPHYVPGQRAILEWTESFRDRCHSALRRQLTQDLHLLRQRADWRSVELIARRTLELDPMNESATLCLAESVARTGSKVLGLAVLEKYEHDLGNATPHLALPSQLLRKRISAGPPTQPSASFGSSPLGGRAEEMQALTHAWQCSREGLFRVLVVTGDKSIGKSRLLEELAGIVRLEGSGTVLQIRPSMRDKERPLSLFADLVRQLQALPGAAGCDPGSLPLLRRLTEALPPGRPIGADHGHSQYDDAGVRNALADLLASVSDERPLLCLIDDANALDAASLAMIRALQLRLASSRTLIVLSARKIPTELDVTSGTAVAILHIHPLSYAASKELYAAIASRANPAIDAGDGEWCLEVAAGNPGHLELLVGSTTLVRQSRSVPADIVALTDERIAALSAEAQHSLQALAVSGVGVWPSGVARLTGLADYALLSALSELDNASLIRTDARGLLCRSALVAERSLNAASHVAIALIHERSAEMLEQEFPHTSREASIAWRIAGHWKAAQRPKLARECLRACWQQAINIGQPMIACSSIRKEMLDANVTEDHAELLDDLIGALQAAGEVGLVYRAIEERKLLSDRIGDGRSRRASLAFDALEAQTLDLSTPALHIESLLQHVQSSDLDSRRRLRAARLLMMAADVMIDEALARHTITVGESIVPSDRTSDLLQRHLTLIFHTVFGDPATALSIIAEIDAMVATEERSWSKFASRRNCSLARQLVGEGTSYFEELERDYFECVDASMYLTALQCASHLTSILIDDGDIGRATEWIAIAERLIASAEVTCAPVDYLSGQVDLALLAGNEDRARRFLGTMQKNAPTYSSGRFRNDLLLYRLRVEQVCQGRQATSDELDELLKFHRIGRRFGRHDDHMDVLWVALRSAGRSDEASQLLTDYLREHRRERRSCRHFLKKRTASDPAWLLQGLGPLPSN